MNKSIWHACGLILVSLLAGAGSSYCQNLQLLGSGGIPSYISVNEIAIDNNYVYLATNTTGLWIIDISNPAHPRQAGQFSAEPFHAVDDLSIANEYAFLNAYFYGVAVLDISDPDNISEIAIYPDLLRYTDILAIGHYIYLARSDTLTIIDVADFNNPIVVANYPTSGYLVGNLQYQGSYLYYLEADRIETYDISNPDSIFLTDWDLVSQYGELTIDNARLYISGQWQQVEVYSLADPANPAFKSSIRLSKTAISVSDANIFSYLMTPDSSVMYAYDISNLSRPLFKARAPITQYNYPMAFCSRNDTTFVTGNSFFNIYTVTGQAKGALSGRIRYVVDNHPIEGVIVTLNENYSIDTTDADGYFIFPDIYNNVPYRISVAHPDYYPNTFSGFTANANDTSYYDIYIGHGWRIDIGVAGLASPPKLVKADTTYAVVPILANYSVDTLSFDYITEAYLIQNPIPLFSHSSHVELLPPGSAIRPLVDSLYVLPDTLYKIVVYTTLAIDNYHRNDTLTYYCSSETTQVEVWYGSLDNTPVRAPIGGIASVDVYIKTRPDVYVGNILLNLGANDLYIDSLMSNYYGNYYSTLLYWDYSSFLNPSHSPPNRPGWSAESYWGQSDAGGAPNPFLNLPEPIKIATMVLQAVYDTSLCGDTVAAFGPGLHVSLGHSYAGDSVGGPGFPVTEHFPQMVFGPKCDYVSGDLNGDKHAIGGDVTYAVRYFKAQGPPPVDSCYMDSTGAWFYPAGDVNGNCEFRGSDITRMVAYFKSTAALAYCHFFLPAQTGK
jgi:hypothetical protein